MKWRRNRADKAGRPVWLAAVSGKLGLFFLAGVLGLGGIAWAGLRGEGAARTIESEPLPNAESLSLLQPAEDAPTPSIEPAAAIPSAPTSIGQAPLLVFARRSLEGSHLWAQPAGQIAQYQLSSGEYDDRDPAVSPDGGRLAFASNRSGGWDLYLMDLASGDIRRLTETEGYEGRPTWSPDGLWLAYEAYYGNDLDIWVLPVGGGQPAIQLTSDPASDLAPSWDPSGRRIAFISDREGSPDLYLADLDKPVDRFTNLTQTAEVSERDPAFDPSGSRIAYSTHEEGLEQIWMIDAAGPGLAEWVGQGRRPSWQPSGGVITAILDSPTRSQVVTYDLGQGQAPVGVSVAGRLEGMSWSASALLPGWATQAEPAAPTETSQDSGRLGLVGLSGVVPEGSALSQAAYDAFVALRQRSVRAVGWDFLGQLDLAFVDLNDPLPPGFAYNDWLHTGRAFAFSQSAYQAGWVEVVREDFGAQTYWQIYVRTANQDGTLGEPLRVRPWDFDARYSGDPAVYDQGGSLKPSIPVGYYVNFSDLAADSGFERLPALNNWRTFYPAARFNEFALRQGLDWEQAMLQLYPPEAIATPTPFQTPTQTPTNTPRPTPTPWWLRWRTPTFTPSPNPTATPNPGP